MGGKRQTKERCYVIFFGGGRSKQGMEEEKLPLRQKAGRKGRTVQFSWDGRRRRGGALPEDSWAALAQSPPPAADVKKEIFVGVGGWTQYSRKGSGGCGGCRCYCEPQSAETEPRGKRERHRRFSQKNIRSRKHKKRSDEKKR